MLPTKGYFQDIECPYFDSSCGRPYCHFRHRKKPTESVEETASESEKDDVSPIPTYKPTPKSELANIHNKSHIPISYVPDLTFRPDRKSRPLPKFDKPTYKPTPLSILSSANKHGSSICEEENGEHTEAIKEIKQNIANVEYDPAISLQPTLDIDFEDLSTEFDLIDEIISAGDKIQRSVEIENKSINKAAEQRTGLLYKTGDKNNTDDIVENNYEREEQKQDEIKTKESTGALEKPSAKSEKYSDKNVEKKEKKSEKHSEKPNAKQERSSSKKEKTSETILVGHSLESDMKALKIVHGTVIDTSVLFPHKMGLPHKRALRALASEHLRKIIQNDISGHDSAEDAITCMELIKWKLKEELKVRSK
ncbi:hypothetical protein NQ318_003221 [Aromia moschata]|uniref:Exonuclease domain-containing protein n=1 Tax=Aromia moschata TaxID=1265417 RepID=A0AAV8YQI6_9CUCU|nr:hypothetical protein NQ318_003221 [Aromia moschata]